MTENVDELEVLVKLTEANRLRSLGDPMSALSMLSEVEPFLQSLNPEEHPKTFSLFHYEKANVFQILGDYQSSVSENNKSSESALAGGDKLRGWVAKFTGGVARYLGNMLTPTEYMEVLNTREKEYIDLGQIDPDDMGLYNSFRFSLKYAKANLQYDLNDKAYLNSVDTVLADEHFRTQLSRGVTAFRWIDLRLRSRESAMNGDLTRAIGTFKKYVEVSGPTSLGDREIIDHVRTWPVEYARDYRDYGVTLTKTGDEQHLELAKTVWRAALDKTFGVEQEGYDWGNLRYRKEIEALLRQFA